MEYSVREGVLFTSGVQTRGKDSLILRQLFNKMIVKVSIHVCVSIYHLNYLFVFFYSLLKAVWYTNESHS